MSTDHHCPVNGCGDRLGTTRTGTACLLCRRHWFQLSNSHQTRLWRAYSAWQRLERQRARLRAQSGEIPPALLSAIAEAVSAYIDVRNDCIREVSGPTDQLEAAL